MFDYFYLDFFTIFQYFKKISSPPTYIRNDLMSSAIQDFNFKYFKLQTYFCTLYKLCVCFIPPSLNNCLRVTNFFKRSIDQRNTKRGYKMFCP